MLIKYLNVWFEISLRCISGPTNGRSKDTVSFSSTRVLRLDESIERSRKHRQIRENLPYSYRVKFVIRFVGYRDPDAFVGSSVHAGWHWLTGYRRISDLFLLRDPTESVMHRVFFSTWELVWPRLCQGRFIYTWNVHTRACVRVRAWCVCLTRLGIASRNCANRVSPFTVATRNRNRSIFSLRWNSESRDFNRLSEDYQNFVISLLQISIL